MVQDFKSILKHGSIYSLGNILSKIVGFLMIPIYTNYLTPADYGVLEMLTLVTAVASMVLALRLTAGLTRYYREYNDDKNKDRLVSTAVVFTASITIVAIIVMIYFSEVISWLVFQSTEYSDYFVLIFISLAFELAGSVTYAYFRILEKSLFFISISLLQLVLGLSMNIYFLVVLKWGINGLLYSMIISNGVACILLLGYTFMLVQWGFEFAKLKQMVVFSLPFIPAGIMIFILNMGDRFLLNRLSSLSEVGIYALGYKFGMLLSVFVGEPFNSIWRPKSIEIYKDRANRDEIFTRVFTYLSFILAFLGLAISVLIKDMLVIIAAPEYWPAYQVVPLITLGYLFYILYYVVDIGFYFNNKTFWYAIINVTAAVSNIVLNLLLIPRFGAMGAAFVTAVSFFICPLMAYFVSQRYYALQYDFVRVGKLVLVTVICYWAGNSVAMESVTLNIALKSLTICLMPVLLYFIGFFEDQELTFVKNALYRYFRLEKAH